MQHTCVGMTRKLRFESSVISYSNQTEKQNGLVRALV